MSSNIMKIVLKSVSLLLLLTAAGTVFAEYNLNIPKPHTPNATVMYNQNMFSIWVCFWIGVVVFGAMIISIIFHRKSKGAKPASFHESTALEVAWTIVPFGILIAFGVYATSGILQVEDTTQKAGKITVDGKTWSWTDKNNKKSELNVKVVAHQWYWTYEILEGHKTVYKFDSVIDKSHKEASLKGKDVSKIKNYMVEVDKPLYLPTNTKIRFLITADAKDVIHSWWIPKLGVKRDAIPGFMNEAWTVIDASDNGKFFRGQCAELCGTYHAFMPIVVKAVSKEKFKEWLAAGKSESQKLAKVDWNKTNLMSHGKKVYEAKCAACHKPDGSGTPPAFPALKGSKIANGKAADHIGIVLKGKNAMPAFKTMSDADLAAVITYERNSWGNKGSVVKPADIKAARAR